MVEEKKVLLKPEGKISLKEKPAPKPKPGLKPGAPLKLKHTHSKHTDKKTMYIVAAVLVIIVVAILLMPRQWFSFLF